MSSVSDEFDLMPFAPDEINDFLDAKKAKGGEPIRKEIFRLVAVPAAMIGVFVFMEAVEKFMNVDGLFIKNLVTSAVAGGLVYTSTLL